MKNVFFKLFYALLFLVAIISLQACSADEDESVFNSSKAADQTLELKKLAMANGLQIQFSDESTGFSDEEYNELVGIIKKIGMFEGCEGKLYSESCSFSGGVMSSLSKPFPVMRRDIENGQKSGKIKYESVTFGVSVGWVTTPAYEAAISDVTVSASSDSGSSWRNVTFVEDTFRREWSGWSDTYDGTMVIYGTLSYTTKLNHKDVNIHQQMVIVSKINSSSNSGDYSVKPADL